MRMLNRFVFDFEFCFDFEFMNCICRGRVAGAPGSLRIID
jgi:hypothetical protein